MKEKQLIVDTHMHYGTDPAVAEDTCVPYMHYGNAASVIRCLDEQNADWGVLFPHDRPMNPPLDTAYEKANVEVAKARLAYPNRIVNIHPSLLPSFGGKGYYGLKVHEAVLSAGVKLTGATVHFVDEGTDTGPIIMQKAVRVYPSDTPEVLQARVMEQAEHIILPKVVRLLVQDKICVKQRKVYVEEEDQ